MYLNEGTYGVFYSDQRFVQESESWSLASNTYEEDGWEQCQLMLTANAEIDIQALVYLRIPLADILSRLGAESASMLVNSPNINNGTAGLTTLPFAGKQERGEPLPESAWWTVIQAHDMHAPYPDKCLLFGFRTPVQHRTFLRQREDFLEIGCLIDRKLRPGETFAGDILVVKLSDSAHDLLEEFGDLCARTTPGICQSERPITWNSWDYYWTVFDEQDLHENLAALQQANNRLATPVSTVVIDMGWYTDFGDWFANGRFPSGIESAARTIREAGFVPGIWVAPYIVHWSSKAYLRSPQICAVGEKGFVCAEQWGLSPAGRLDPTHPDGARFLFDTFKRLYDSGFRYFKLDFLHFLVTLPGKRCFHENAGRIEVVRRGLQVIREAIGEDSYLLACGCQPEATVGVVNACRIGGDISTYFSTTKVCARFLATRYWMNNRLFTADPDFLIVRGDATACDPEFRHNPYHAPDVVDDAGSRSGEPWASENEIRIWATLVGMSGGSLTLSDHTGKLNDRGYHILNTAISNASTEAAIPLDLMENALPELWLRKVEKPALTVVNWSDEEKSIVLPVAKYPELTGFSGALDVWGGSAIEKADDSLVVTLSPHDVAWFVQEGNNGQ